MKKSKMCSYDPLLPTKLEQLPIELFRNIFEYLAPYDLILAFQNLNIRFSSIIRQIPFCLPNNAHMSMIIYRQYITKILPEYHSQIVYLHLAEGRCVDAVNWLVRTFEHHLFSSFANTLRAIKMVYINRDTLESLINHLYLVPQVHTLSLTLERHDYEPYYLSHAFYWSTIITSLPRLKSLSISNISFRYDLLVAPDYDRMALPIAQHLQALKIKECSLLLIATLINGGHVPHLRHLWVDSGWYIQQSRFV
jgi:hypothetical protein